MKEPTNKSEIQHSKMKLFPPQKVELYEEGFPEEDILQRWVEEHSKAHGNTSTVIYFDAFAHDYISDSLPALVSALIEQASGKDKDNFKKVKEVAFKLTKYIARKGLAKVTGEASEIILKH